MRQRARPWMILAWHGLSIVLLLALASVRLHLPFWQARREEFSATCWLVAAYAVVALISAWYATRSRTVSARQIVVAFCITFGAACFFFLLKDADPEFSRSLLLILLVGSAALSVCFLALLDSRWSRPALAILGIGTLAGVLFVAYRSAHPRSPPITRTESDINTAFYVVHAVTYDNAIPKSVFRGGAIDRIGDRFLVATGTGELYLFSWPAGGKLGPLRRLPFGVPYNVQDFIVGSGTHWDLSKDANTERAYETPGAQVWQFRVADVLVRELGDRVQIFASHHHWKSDEKCFVVRVSMLDADRNAVLSGARVGEWKTVFDTRPCLPISGPQARRSNNPFGGMEVGGRMQFRDADTLLLTVGDHDFSGIDSDRILAQDPNADYGKTILIHLHDSSSEVFTSGHRSPQGLLVEANGAIWETEHGPQGGDELNYLVAGKNYGWPLVTYGTDYGSPVWTLNKHQGQHEGFELPAFAWVPSIGISSLLQLSGKKFPIWKDDLLIASLHGKSVYRVRVEGQRVVFVEPIQIGERIRDMVEADDGRILLWTDSHQLVSLDIASGSSGPALFAMKCGGCHKIDANQNDTFGPNLHGIVGRKPASNSDYPTYSPAMKAQTEPWSEERLNAFLEHPQGVVPGTSMSFPGVADAQERAALVHFLHGAD